MKKLVKSILKWWEEHRFDTYSDNYGEEYNIYDEEPEFVTLAKKLLLKTKNKK